MLMRGRYTSAYRRCSPVGRRWNKGGLPLPKPVDSKKVAPANTDAGVDIFHLAINHLPENLVEDLAREVVRRLSFRMPGMASTKGGPTAKEIDRFCAALLSQDDTAADRIIRNVQREGAEIETIYLGYITGASRRLGEMWENDQVSFIEVGLGTGRLYRVLRGLRHTLAPVLLRGRTRSPAMFALVPGETHSLGLEIAADLFRRDGGDADVCIGKSHDEILTIAEERHHGVIVLVANSSRVLPALIRLSVAVRISQPVTPIALAGHLIDSDPTLKTVVGADLVISDIRRAVVDLRHLTEGDDFLPPAGGST